MIKIFSNIEELTRFAAERFVETAMAAIDSEIGSFAVALSGGSTPKALYQILAGQEFRNRLDWTKVFFFFGDERNVLPDDPDSNFRLAREYLFEPLQIDAANIFRWQTELDDARRIAWIYECDIEAFFESEPPRFDLILLGMGDDGHTASLFPHTEALGETAKTAVANRVEKLNATRLTMTFPVINDAKNVIFLVAGAEKAEALREVLEGEPQPEKFPAQNVKLQDGNLFWLVDKEAARLLQ